VRVYLDSCIVIYLVEEHLDYGPRLATILADLSKDTEIFLQLSDLTNWNAWFFRSGKRTSRSSTNIEPGLKV